MDSLLREFLAERDSLLPHLKQKPHVYLLTRILRDWLGKISTSWGLDGVVRLLEGTGSKHFQALTIESWPYNAGEYELDTFQVPYPLPVRAIRSEWMSMQFPSVEHRGLLVAASWATRFPLRHTLQAHCDQRPGKCHFLATGSKNWTVQATAKLYSQAVFCLQPHGDSASRNALYDCCLHGTIPVVFQRDYPFAFGSMLPWHKMAFFVSEDELKSKNIVDILSEVPQSEVKERRANLLSQRHLLQYSMDTDYRALDYNNLTKYDDAVTVSIKYLAGVLENATAPAHAEATPSPGGSPAKPLRSRSLRRAMRHALCCAAS